MRLKITFEIHDGNIFLPSHYNYYIQALIYRIFSKQIAEILHNRGFLFGKRSFKLFTFSRILEKGIRQGDKLVFKRQISFYFSSPLLKITEDFGMRALNSSTFNLLGQQLFVSGLEIVTPPAITETNLIKMLSPMTIHSTLRKGDGTRKCYYYKPVEAEFSKLIKENAKKKYYLINNNEPTDLHLEVKPFHFSVKENLCVVKFKQTPIEGYTGIFELKGSKELIQTTYDAGIGDKNPEGFGMWELWKGGRSA